MNIKKAWKPPFCGHRLPGLLSILIVACLYYPAALQARESWNAPHDYYTAALQGWGELLKNVEKYHLPQGIEKMNQKRYGPAWADFDFMLRYFPNHPKALLLISDLALRMKRPEEAEKLLTRAITMFPNQAPSHIIYGIFLQKTGRLDDAISQYERALAINPNDSESHYNLGLALLKKGQHQAALEHAQKAYELGYPLPGLRNKLIAAGIWPSTGQRRKDQAGTRPSPAPK